MSDKFWKQFKSGTDIRGVAIEGVEGQNVNLTDEVIEKITSAFVLWLTQKTGKSATDLKISVGHDSRISANRIKSAVLRVLFATGVSALDCSLASTPAMFMTTVDLECDGAIQITASHHPFNRNGLKFFTRDGGLEARDIDSILNMCNEDKGAELDKEGTYSPCDYTPMYCNRLCDMIKREINAELYDLPLEGFKIVVDAGNGAGGFYAKNVLAALGADTNGSRFLEPDGMFPNHIPNPEDSEAMDSICEAVRESGADLGIIFDTDVDRAGCVDSNGKEINRNRLVALASAIALENNAGGTIVTDSITSDGLKEFIENDLGGSHYRFRRGYKNVIDRAIELNNKGINCPLAIETSGHAALRENYFLDDGAYLVTKIVIKMAKLRNQGSSIDKLIETLREPMEAAELRIKITEENFAACGNKIIQNLENYASERDGWNIAPDNREGIRVFFNDSDVKGWFLLRLSVHDPILPLNIEGDTVGGVKVIAKKLEGFLNQCNGIDVSPLTEFLSK